MNSSCVLRHLQCSVKISVVLFAEFVVSLFTDYSRLVHLSIEWSLGAAKPYEFPSTVCQCAVVFSVKKRKTGLWSPMQTLEPSVL